MFILVLDDNKLIIHAAESYFVDPHDFRKDTIVQVASPDAFWTEYNKREFWDEVWLDHDLGNPQYSGKNITLQFYNEGNVHAGRVGTFRVITNNTSAASGMVSDLERTEVEVLRYPQSFLVPLGISRGDFIIDRENPIIHNPQVTL